MKGQFLIMAMFLLSISCVNGPPKTICIGSSITSTNWNNIHIAKNTSTDQYALTIYNDEPDPSVELSLTTLNEQTINKVCERTTVLIDATQFNSIVADLDKFVEYCGPDLDNNGVAITINGSTSSFDMAEPSNDTVKMNGMNWSDFEAKIDEFVDSGLSNCVTN